MIDALSRTEARTSCGSSNGEESAASVLLRLSRRVAMGRSDYETRWGVKRALRASDVEAEVDDVAVLDDVLLALEAQLAGLAALGLAAVVDEVLVVGHLGADEAAFDVAVDLAGGAHGRRA